jgi:predicted DNA-binding transcriptional regulator AlpA
MRKPKKPGVYRVRDIMQIMGISKTSAYDLCRQNLFPVKRVGSKGGAIRIPKEPFDAWFKSLEEDQEAS